MANAKSINLFLLDGEATGRVKCTLHNTTGIIYKIPRMMLESCKDSTNDISRHLKQTGIYFLIGENSETGNKAIYIGQASVRKNGDGIYQRLIEHKQEKSNLKWTEWNEIVVLTTQANNLGATQISFLENSFTKLAQNANRFEVKNGNEPTKGNVSEEEECVMLEFIELTKLMIGVLGYKVFEPLLKKDHIYGFSKTKENIIFKFKGKFAAEAVYTNEGFVLVKGSHINSILNNSAHGFTRKSREEFKTKIDENYATTEDLLFSSPSAAAGFVGGCSLSGNTSWKTIDGKSPKDINLQGGQND